MMLRPSTKGNSVRVSPSSGRASQGGGAETDAVQIQLDWLLYAQDLFVELSGTRLGSAA
jgi:hypothetical protein